MEHFYPAAPASVTCDREGTRKAAAADRKKSGTRGGGGGNGVRLSTDPQSVAARQRRHRISDRFKILQGLVPGGDKMDTASLLEEAIRYVKFLKSQIRLHQSSFGGLTDEDDCGEEADPPLPPGAVHDHPPVEYSVPYSDDCCLGNHVTDAPPFYSVGDSVAAAQPLPAAVEFGYIEGCDSVFSYPQMNSVFSYPHMNSVFSYPR